MSQIFTDVQFIQNRSGLIASQLVLSPSSPDIDISLKPVIPGMASFDVVCSIQFSLTTASGETLWTGIGRSTKQTGSSFPAYGQDVGSGLGGSISEGLAEAIENATEQLSGRDEIYARYQQMQLEDEMLETTLKALRSKYPNLDEDQLLREARLKNITKFEELEPLAKKLVASKRQPAKSWKEVEKSPRYLALSPEEKDAAKNQYFEEVIAPQGPPESRKAARQEFISKTTRPAAQTEASGTSLTRTTSAGESSSIVDQPTYKLKEQPNNFALVIGIEKYKKLPQAEFAESDAAAIRRHLLAMGYPERNIIYLGDEEATRSQVQAYLEEWLPKNVQPNSSVFFYFSGHGAPDAATKEAYLLPWDGNPRFLQTTAYPLKQIYSSLNKLKAKDVVVVLDACFSGAGGRSVLAKGARPLVMKVSQPADLGKTILFTATSEDEITGSLEEKGHGIFTYYFLKGLAGEAKDAVGVVTAKGLHEYLKPLVQDEARRQNREQTPVLLGPQQDRPIVSFR